MVHSMQRSLHSGYGHVPGMQDDGNWSDVHAWVVQAPSVSFVHDRLKVFAVSCIKRRIQKIITGKAWSRYPIRKKCSTTCVHAPTLGPFGVSHTMEKICWSFYWTGLKGIAKKSCRKCDQCASQKPLQLNCCSIGWGRMELPTTDIL